MHTRNHEDIVRTVGLTFFRDAFVKDICSWEALYLENRIQSLIEVTMIETSKKRCS
jgi:hypothetical protein